MRHIQRSNSFTFKKNISVNNSLKKIQHFISQNSLDRSPKFSNILYRMPDFKTSLKKEFCSKCAYCESKVDDITIDHYRPIGAQSSGDDYSNKHYVWLQFEIENILLTCRSCNAYKSNLFPVIGERGNVNANINELRKNEIPVIIDPTFDPPHHHLGMTAEGLLFGKSERGTKTIEILNLNRNTLINSRKRNLSWFFLLWNELRTTSSINARLTLQNSLMPDAEYSGSILLYLFQHTDAASNFNLPPDDDLLDLLSVITQDELTGSLPQSQTSHTLLSFFDNTDMDRYITYAHIKNFKGIKSSEIDLPTSINERVSSFAILGENGAGKTSLLQAICLGILGPDRANHLLNSKTIDYLENLRNFETTVVFSDNTANKIKFDLKENKFTGKSESTPILVAYGAYRTLEKGNTSRQLASQNFRVETLFNDDKKISGPLAFYSNIENENLFESATRALSELFGNFGIKMIVDSNRKIVLSINDRITTIDELSSGFKSILCIAGDLMVSMFDRNLSTEIAQAIVLIDEVDAHLHPSWKIKVISCLRNAFPKVQFIFTTHDPLLLRGMNPSEVLLLESHRGVASITNYDFPFNDLSIDQILTSDIFGLRSAHSPEEDVLMKDYYELLENPIKNKKQINEIELQMDNLNLLGITKRDRIFYRLIDEYLVKNKSRRGLEWSRKTVEDLLKKQRG